MSGAFFFLSWVMAVCTSDCVIGIGSPEVVVLGDGILNIFNVGGCGFNSICCEVCILAGLGQLAKVLDPCWKEVTSVHLVFYYELGCG